MAELITVVLPTRNAAADVDACLASLQRQQYQSFEVCVVDGGSSDATLAVVKSYSGKVGESLCCRSEPDRGIYDAMNKGVSMARGEWIHFIGADDVIHDATVFSDVADCMADSQADIVYGDVIKKSSGSRYGGESSLDRLLFEGNICHQGMFYRRSVFERVGGYSARYPIWADWELNIRCFRHPGIRTHWMDRLVAIYSDASGCSRDEDAVFRRELPVTLLSDAARQRSSLLNSRSYRFGKKLFGWLDE